MSALTHWTAVAPELVDGLVPMEGSAIEVYRCEGGVVVLKVGDQLLQFSQAGAVQLAETITAAARP